MKIYMGEILSFLAFTSFSFMDIINKFLFNFGNIPFFSYLVYLDSSIIIIITVSSLYLFGTSFLKVKSPKYVLIRSVLSTINTLASLLAISSLPLYIFYPLIISLQPILAVILARITLREKINLTQLIFIITGGIGIFFTVDNLAFNVHSVQGILAASTCALTGALSGTVVRKFMPKENVASITFYNILLSLAVGTSYFLISKEPLYQLHISQASLIFVAGLLACLGMLFFMKSYQKTLKVLDISHFQYTQVIWGILFGYIIFHNSPSFLNLIGILLIIISNIVITRRSLKI